MTTQEKIESYLKTLSLHQITEIYQNESENAAKAKLSYQDFLLRLLEQQVLTKIDRSINRRIQIAGFPAIKRLEEFDFSYQPQLDEKLIRELTNLIFLDEAKNVIFLGPPGVGKTHLAISLGIKACQMRKRVLFYSAEQLTQELAAAEVSGNLQKVLLSLARVDLLIIDELGYLELSKKTATLFFQLISKRYETASVIITSNKPFEEWGEIFQDDVVAAAILDRLLHHCYSFFIQGKSFRMKHLVKK
jgi:DNA replication protein DnaC